MKYKTALISIIAVILGLIVGALFMLFSGHNPAEGYNYLLQGALKNSKNIGNTLATATPLILTGLSITFAFRTGLFNIGVPGQMLFGGFCATAIGLSFNTLPAIVLLPLMIVGGFLGGALAAAIPGILKAFFNVHEVVSGIMMNWICYWFVFYTIPAYFKGTMETESKLLSNNATLRTEWLTNLFPGSFINLGIFIAIIAVIVVAFILNKTTFGYALKAVGFNRDAAEYGGISVNTNIILSIMIAGGLAGLGGVVQYAGNATSLQIGILPTQGFDGIAVALLGATTPIGSLFAALFFGVLYAGRGFMTAMTDIPPEIASTIIAVIIYFAATSVLVENFLDKILKKKKDKKETSEPASDGLLTTPIQNSDEDGDELGFLPPGTNTDDPDTTTDQDTHKEED